MPRRRPPRPGTATRRPTRRAPGIAGIDSRLEDLLEEVSCATLGRLVGTHPENVRRYRTGTVTPPVKFLASVAVAYGCSLDWLVLGKGKGGG